VISKNHRRLGASAHSRRHEELVSVSRSPQPWDCSIPTTDMKSNVYCLLEVTGHQEHIPSSNEILWQVGMALYCQVTWLWHWDLWAVCLDWHSSSHRHRPILISYTSRTTNTYSVNRNIQIKSEFKIQYFFLDLLFLQPLLEVPHIR